jgi:hypothetical protein
MEECGEDRRKVWKDEEDEDGDEEEDEEEEEDPAQKTPGYRVKTRLDNGMLQIIFDCVVGGFLTVQFDLRLREKLMSNDTQLTLNFHRVEQTQTMVLERIDVFATKMLEIASKMKEMERRLEALGHADICFTQPPSCTNKVRDIQSFPIDSKTLYINSENNAISTLSFQKIKYFYQLEQLHIDRCDWVPATNISNATVKKLLIHNSNQFGDISFIQNFPNLEELEMKQLSVDPRIVSTLRAVNHNINTLTFQTVSGINQTEMQTYCTQKGIKLNLS